MKRFCLMPFPKDENTQEFDLRIPDGGPILHMWTWNPPMSDTDPYNPFRRPHGIYFHDREDHLIMMGAALAKTWPNFNYIIAETKHLFNATVQVDKVTHKRVTEKGILP